MYEWAAEWVQEGTDMGQVNVNPGGGSGSRSGGGVSMVLVISLVLLIVVLLLAYFILWPMLSAQPQAPAVNVNVRS